MAKNDDIKEIEDLPGIGEATAEKLRAAGYDTLEKVAVASPHELAEVAEMSVDAAKKAIEAAKNATKVEFITGMEEYERRQSVAKIDTNSKNLNQLIGGGIETRGITEVYGRFASGKSQIGFQLSVNVQLPPERGGLGGGVLFIDTEGTFRPERISEIATAKGLDYKSVLENIYLIRAGTTEEQILAVEHADKLIEEKNIKLIVVDSLTALFRAEFVGRSSLGERQQKLAAHLHKLQSLADKYNLAVYITNQVMDNPAVSFADPTTPIGGNILAHAATVRLYIKKSRENKRVVRLVDSPFLPEGECVIKITSEGISD
ncbi:MAG: DNA repair and recombination protein RadA [Candidatus Micrarchaeota archaeon]|nr:MAG: DNA repair and recombination protein RadA [Candidatus Micrarchaeota archaeon]